MPTEAHLPHEPEALDASFWNLDKDDLDFLVTQTGISDEPELRKHVFDIQEEAYKVYPYGCIRGFNGFVRLKISKYPAYQHLLKLGRERPGALFLDLGCCVGNDVRKAVIDGYPAKQILTADLHPEFWEIGHKLFKTTPETFPVTFIPTDVFDHASLAPAPLPTSTPSSLPDPTTVKSLNDLHGSLSAIHSSAFFHLFDEEKQLELAKLVAPLLSPEPGSIIFGGHNGLLQKGFRPQKNHSGRRMFAHSPESWKELWEKQVFQEGQVRVDAELVEVVMPHWGEGDLSKGHILRWSVTRL